MSRHNGLDASACRRAPKLGAGVGNVRESSADGWPMQDMLCPVLGVPPPLVLFILPLLKAPILADPMGSVLVQGQSRVHPFTPCV